MKKARKILALFLALILAVTLQTGVFAAEQAQPAQAVEQPSAWAFEGVQWSAIYGLARQDMFAKYASYVTREELYAVGVNLYQRITGKTVAPVEKSPFIDADSPAVLSAYAIKILTGGGKFEPQREATRLEMVTAVYNVLKAAGAGLNFDTDIALTGKDAEEIPAASLEAVKYAVSKELIKGTGGGNLNLSASCTRQELMVFAKRVYEFVIYETGKASKGLLWKASDEDSTVYLLGSVHIADPSVYPLSKAVLTAFDNSDALVVEADLINQNDGIQYMQQKMMYTGDETLDKNVPKDLYDRFVEAIKPLGLKPEVYNKMKPWYAALLAQNIQLTQDTYDASLGVDLYFTAKAAGKKNILEIEGLKFQVDMFDSFSNELQLQFLSSVLTPDESSQQQSIEAFASMVEGWKQGDAAAVEKLLAAEDDGSAQAKEYDEKMWSARNNNMYQKTKAYLADPSGKTYFIVVGAGHMLGEDGVITQLKGSGYDTEQVK